MFTKEDLEAFERGSKRIDAARKRVIQTLGMLTGLAVKKNKSPNKFYIGFLSDDVGLESSLVWDREGNWSLELIRKCSLDAVERILAGRDRIPLQSVLAIERELPTIANAIIEQWSIQKEVDVFVKIGQETD